MVMIPATISRGDIVLCDLNPVIGTEQAGIRPVIILQIDRANAASPHTIIVPFTTKIQGYMKEIGKALSAILGLLLVENGDTLAIPKQQVID